MRAPSEERACVRAVGHEGQRRAVHREETTGSRRDGVEGDRSPTGGRGRGRVQRIGGYEEADAVEMELQDVGAAEGRSAHVSESGCPVEKRGNHELETRRLQQQCEARDARCQLQQPIRQVRGRVGDR